MTDVTKVDFGGHFYATEVFPQMNTTEALAITWMQNWDKPQKYLGNSMFSGVMTYIRRMKLINYKLF